jgi:hypothetical protein
MFGTLNPLDKFAFKATYSDVFLTIPALPYLYVLFENGNEKNYQQ